jgi:hypothetical protein
VTTRAREVLADCERLLAALPADIPTSLWRPRWAGLVTLLRTVGHVLDKVDGNRSAAGRNAVDAACACVNQTKPKPRILWEFIEAERNNVVKLYELSVAVNTIVRPGTAGFTQSTEGGTPSFDAFVHMGPFKGRDPLQLCREAVEFWRVYLDGVDARIAQIEAGQKEGGR